MAQSGPSAGGYGINYDAWPPGAESVEQSGQFGNFGQILQALMQQYQPQENFSDVLETKARLRNPEELCASAVTWRILMRRRSRRGRV